MSRRLAVALGGILTAVLLAPAASAHVTVQPGEAVKGSYAKLAFRVPNEEDDAATVKLQVQLPEEIESARTKPLPGWTATVNGREITWEGGRIEPGEFQEFEISVGPLPEIDEVAFKAIQTYENGIVASWIEEVGADGEEPDKPAPILRLVAGDDGHGAPVAHDEGEDDEDGTELAAQPVASVDQDDVDGARTLGIVGIVVGALGLVAAAAAFTVGRRRS